MFVFTLLYKIDNMFEVIAKDKNGEAEVLMYGTINDWGSVSSRVLAQVLNELAGKYQTINARIHSPGGLTFEADAIGSVIESLRKKGKTINAYVDGIAASAMADLTTYFSKVFIAKSGKMMLHQARGNVSGQSGQLRDAANLLDMVNEGMAERFGSKANKDKKWVLDNWLQAGKDKWFSASEAVAVGLADELITDSKQIPEGNLSEAQVIAQYDLIFNPDAYLASTNKNSSIMNPKLFSILTLLGLTVQANASDDDCLFMIENALKNLKDNAEKNAAKLREFEAKIAQSELAEINALIETKRIIPEQAEQFRKMLSSVGFEAVKTLLNTFETPKDLSKSSKNTQSNGTQTTNRDAWTLEQWEKEDPAGLKAKMQSDKDWYDKKFEIEYGII